MAIAVDSPETPVVLIVAPDNVDPRKLMQCIVRDDSPAYIQNDDSIRRLPWRIENKYYTADVQLAAVKAASDVDEPMWNRVGGVILLYDMDDPTSHSTVIGDWHSAIDENANAEVLLCCGVTSQPANQDPAMAADDNADDSMLVSEAVLDWCSQNQFEHVCVREWSHASSDVHASTLLEERFGVDRVVEALHACMWPNMVLSEQAHPPPANSLHGNTIPATNRVAPSPPEQEPDALAGFLSPEELALLNGGLFSPMASLEHGDMDESDDLGIERAFALMATLKERTQSMPDEQRRMVAERVALAFMQAMGEDDDEPLSD